MRLTNFRPSKHTHNYFYAGSEPTLNKQERRIVEQRSTRCQSKRAYTGQSVTPTGVRQSGWFGDVMTRRCTQAGKVAASKREKKKKVKRDTQGLRSVGFPTTMTHSARPGQRAPTGMSMTVTSRAVLDAKNRFDRIFIRYARSWWLWGVLKIAFSSCALPRDGVG